MKGTVHVLVIEALSWRPMRGFGISQWLEERSRIRRGRARLRDETNSWLSYSESVTAIVTLAGRTAYE
jgi:hypothetical protein